MKALLIKSFVTLFLCGAALGLLLYFTKPEYVNEFALDTVAGAAIEFFALTLILHFFEVRQDKKSIEHLEDHLRKIEALIYKAETKKEK